MNKLKPNETTVRDQLTYIRAVWNNETDCLQKLISSEQPTTEMKMKITTTAKIAREIERAKDTKPNEENEID